MKIDVARILCMAAVAVVGVVAMAGCSTTRQERSAQTIATMGGLRELLDKGADQTVRLSNATEKLSAANPADLRQAYNQFSREAKVLRSIVADVRSQSAAMKKRSSTYLSKWEKEISSISDSKLKKMSRERQALLEQEFQKITASMADLGQTYTAFEANLADIEKFLGNDLTRVGSGLAKPNLDRLAEEVLKVKSATRSTQDAIAGLEQVLTPR